MLNRGINHAIHPGIHAVDRFSCAKLREVITGRSLADIAPRTSRLELQLFFLRHWQLRRSSGQITIAKPAARLPVNNRMRIGPTFRRRHMPLESGGLNQHDPRRGAGLAHHLKERTDGMRPIRVLITVPTIANRLLDPHPLPVGVHLLSHHQRQGRTYPSAHLRAMRHDVDRAIRVDSNKYIRMQSSPVRMRFVGTAVGPGPRDLGVEARPEHQRSGGNKPCRNPRRLTFSILLMLTAMLWPPLPL